LASPENFGTGPRLYFYAVRLLVERLSWYCRDSRRRSDTGDGSVALVFSNRASMDYQALRVYLERLETDRDAFGYRAAPDVIRADQLCERVLFGYRWSARLLLCTATRKAIKEPTATDHVPSGIPAATVTSPS